MAKRQPTLTATQDTIKGFWRVRLGTRTVGAFVQPIVNVHFGILPTAAEVRTAVLSLFPLLPITDDTPVVIVEHKA